MFFPPKNKFKQQDGLSDGIWLTYTREQETQTRFAPVTLTLTRWRWYMSLTQTFGRCACTLKSSF